MYSTLFYYDCFKKINTYDILIHSIEMYSTNDMKYIVLRSYTNIDETVFLSLSTRKFETRASIKWKLKWYITGEKEIWGV